MSTELTTNPFGSAPIAAAPQAPLGQALMAREVAEVQAAMVVAQRFPRDPVKAVDRIIQNCTRPGLAERAVYEYARGGQAVTGPSIRLAEELARGWGNMLTGVTELSRSNGVSECLAYAWDLESNYRDEKRFQVRHWRDTKKGGYAITDERDLYELVANMGARRKRACILSVIPADVQDAALDQCELTLKTTMEVTPERIKAMLDKFAAYGVTREMVQAKVQRHVETITPALMSQLARIYNSIKDGMSKPADWFEMGDPSPETPTTPPASRTDAVKEKLRSGLNGTSPEPSPAPHDALSTGEVPGGGVTAEAGEESEDGLPFDEGPEEIPAPHSSPAAPSAGVPLTADEAARLQAAKERRRGAKS